MVSGCIKVGVRVSEVISVSCMYIVSDMEITIRPVITKKTERTLRYFSGYTDLTINMEYTFLF